MNGEPYVPPATLDKLSSPSPKGTRHQTAIEIAVPMIGNGASDTAVFALLRGKFEADVTDNELWGVIKWARRQNPAPSTHGANGNGNGYHPPAAAQKPKHPSRTPVEQCEWWTSGARQDPSAMARCSPSPVPEDPAEQMIAFLSALYSDKDSLNIVCDYTTEGDKIRPSGAGRCDTRDGWLRWCKEKGVPHSKAGAWFRMNPCCPVGSGDGGAITDQDITDFRFMLLESDSVPIPVQLALFQRLKLPVALIVTSGGSSAHAWVRIGAVNDAQYSERAGTILKLLKPFGVDSANRNPSRLSRLPGAVRHFGASGDGAQRLLWLNPGCAPLTDKGMTEFEESLAFPAIEEHPLKSLARAAVDRYEYLYNNQGKIGVPTGILKLDAVSGGMKKGQTWVVAGETGGGKSTVGLHIIQAAMKRGIGVLLFSLEMDKEEIFDLIVSNQAEIDRNKFNHGRFETADFDIMRKSLADIAKLPLYIEDSAMTGVDQIRLRTMQLNAAGKVGLVVVDYAQFVSVEWTRENREQQVANISHALRALARETRLPMLVLSQLNDDGKLRESRVLGHNANVVMLVSVNRDQVTVKVVKGRGIPHDEYGLKFDRIHARLIPDELDGDFAEEEYQNTRRSNRSACPD